MSNKDVEYTPVQRTDIPVRKLAWTLLAISMGTVIEWYDYSVYSQLSKVLGSVFFPSGNPALQMISFWGLFAIGFLTRPIGAVLFGHLGDTKGRGVCLLWTVLLMGIPTILIGCLPSYQQIGIAAPILLALLRLIQGLAMGGEFGAAMVYLVELANPRYKAVTGSIGYVSLGAGVVMGILVVTALISLVTEAALHSWGWRVPFLMSIISVVAATLLRYNMPDSSEFNQSHKQIAEETYRRHQQRDGVSADGQTVVTDVEGQAGAQRQQYVPVLELFRGHWRGLLLQSLYGCWLSASFLIGYSWLPSFLVAHGGISTRMTLWMVCSCMVLFTLMVPTAGILADKGLPRLTVTLAICVASVALAIPTFMVFSMHNLALSWLMQALLLAMSGYAMGTLPAVMAAIYPAGVRVSGCNLGVNMSSLMGGVCPLIITAVQASTGSVFYGPAIVLAVTAVITATASCFLIKSYPQANK